MTIGQQNKTFVAIAVVITTLTLVTYTVTFCLTKWNDLRSLAQLLYVALSEVIFLVTI